MKRTSLPLRPARVHHAARRRSGGVADRGNGAADGDAGDRVPQTLCQQKGSLNACASVRQGLERNGYVEGENVAIEYRWAEIKIERLTALAIELVHRQVALIIATGGSAPALAARQRLRQFPSSSAVPRTRSELGLVASLGRPGGNATGINFFTADLAAKRLELLRELVPHAVRVAVLINPAIHRAMRSPRLTRLEDAARALGLQIQIFKASSAREINAAFATFLPERPDALFVGPRPIFRQRGVFNWPIWQRVTRFPRSYSSRDFAEAGGLMSYGTDITDAYRQVGDYAGRVLKGAKPADLPVVQSTKFELVINLKTAKALGLDVPPTLLARADEVIE